MKKIFLFFALIPFLSYAQYYNGTIKFTDGKTKTGLVEYPELTDKKINFKATEKGDKEKLTINEIDQIDYALKNNETVTLIASKYYESSRRGEVKGIAEDKIWLIVVYDGKIKMYKGITNLVYSGMGPNHFQNSRQIIGYYLKTPKKEYPQKVFEDLGSGVGVFKLLKMQIEVYFKEDCPTLADMMDKKEISEKGFIRIAELYDQNCGK